MIKLLLDNCITEDFILNEYNANITYICLPCKVRGFVFTYRNINNIYINNNLSTYMKKKTILHELAHIELNHLNHSFINLNFNLEDLDDEADEYIKNIKNC